MVKSTSDVHSAYCSSKIGNIKILGTVDGIFYLNFTDEKPTASSAVHPCLKDCVTQIDEYFKGKRKTFDLKLKMEGTDFQKKIWKQLMKIPYGETASYKDVAVAVGNKKAVRAVGSANGKNPISIIVPCHRVIGSNGKLVGYGGGLERKRWLLEHEFKYVRK